MNKGFTRHQRIERSNKHGKVKVLLDSGHSSKRVTQERKTKMRKRRENQREEQFELLNKKWWLDHKYVPAGTHANTKGALLDMQALADRPSLDQIVEDWGM